MRSANPPAVATWLLRCLISGPRRESLVGDLVEQFRNGRSRAWYWRQVLVAIVTGAFEDIRTHKLLASWALIVGWALTLGAKHSARVWTQPGDAVNTAIGVWLLTNDHESLRSFWLQSHLSDLPRFTMWWIKCGLVGWTVAYTQRSRQSSMVLLFTASFLITKLPSIIAGLSAAMAAERSELGFIFAGIVWPLGGVASVLVGGLWRVRPGGDLHIVVSPANLRQP